MVLNGGPTDVKLKPLVVIGIPVEPGIVIFGLLVKAENPLELRPVMLTMGNDEAVGG